MRYTLLLTLVPLGSVPLSVRNALIGHYQHWFSNLPQISRRRIKRLKKEKLHACMRSLTLIPATACFYKLRFNP